MKRLTFFGFFLLLLLETSGQQLIAYYSGNAQQITAYPVQGLTHIIYSFCQIHDGKLVAARRADTLTIRRLVALKKNNPRLHVLITFGGWGGCAPCSELFSSESGREGFTSSVKKLLDYFHLDGIDIDWEFPTMPAYPGNPYSPADKENLTSLVQSLREKLGKDKEISVICAGYAPYLKGSLDLPALIPYTDRINLMTYDLIGSKRHRTGHSSALYSTAEQEESADHALRWLDSLAIPHNKVAIGVAFYGRLFAAADTLNNGLYRPAEFDRFATMREIRKSFKKEEGFTEFWDDTAKAAWRFQPSTKTFLTYEDERSVRAKISYVKNKGLAGIFFWELRLDRPEDGLLQVLYAGIKKNKQKN